VRWLFLSLSFAQLVCSTFFAHLTADFPPFCGVFDDPALRCDATIQVTDLRENASVGSTFHAS
jgi:hypothetical protein